jgi:hypothetical protein
MGGGLSEKAPRRLAQWQPGASSHWPDHCVNMDGLPTASHGMAVAQLWQLQLMPAMPDQLPAKAVAATAMSACFQSCPSTNKLSCAEVCYV